MELKIFYRWPYLSFNEFHPSSAAWPLKKKKITCVGTNIRIVFPMRGEKRRESERARESKWPRGSPSRNHLEVEKIIYILFY
jgi:hypothetical protein